MNEPIWEGFTNTKVMGDVLSYLQETGWEIKKQTFYNHCNSGKLQKNRSGLYTKRAVKKYAEQWLVHGGLGSTVGEADENLVQKKLKSEIQRITTTEERERFKLDCEKGKFIPRDQVEKELVSRAIALDTGLDYLFKAYLPEMIAIVGGDLEKAPLLQEFLLQKKNEQMNTFARLDDFVITVEDE